MAQKIQAFDKKLHLFGGTAAQFFISKEFQRTSTDIDLITNYTKEEIEKVVDDFCKGHDITYKYSTLESTYGFRFKLKTKFSFPGSDHTLLEIVSRTKEKFNSQLKSDCSLYDKYFGKFRILKKIDIISKKFVTLDLDVLGMQREKIISLKDELKLGKHLYDIYQLYNSLKKTETDQLNKHIETQFQNDINHLGVSDSPITCIKNVCTIFDSLSRIGMTTPSPNDDTKLFLKGCKNVEHHISKRTQLTNIEWASMGWSFEHLLKGVLKDNENNSNAKTKEHFKRRNKLRKNTDKDFRAQLIKRLSRHYRPSIRARPLESLYFKDEMMHGIV